MTVFERIELALDFYLYISWIVCVIIYRKDWNGMLGYQEEKEPKKKGQ